MVRMYERLEDAEIPVKLDLWEAMPHNFPDRVPDAPESIQARNRMGTFLRRHLGGIRATSAPAPASRT
jgi:monoterpene epsilon-lactone hydrolase